jgi:flagellar protein FliO/FliZ
LGGEKLYKSCGAIRIAAVWCLLQFAVITPFLSAQADTDSTSDASAADTAVSAPADAIVSEDVSLDAVRDAREAERSIAIGETPPGEAPSRTASAGLILRMLVVLVVIALAVYGVVFFMKKASRPPVQTDPNLKVLSTVGLGTGRFVHVVSAGDKAWLIGSAESGVNLISEISDQSVISAMLIEQSRRNSGGQGLPDFKSLLLRMGIQSPRPPGVENIRKRRERFKGL